jgi:acyl-CoA reductase-like NAD-dependent aldehyde dehydrogenase
MDTSDTVTEQATPPAAEQPTETTAAVSPPAAPSKPKTSVVRNPATGKVIATLPAVGKEDIPAMVERARVVQSRWEAIGAYERARLFKALRKWLYAHEAEFVDTLSQEGGKPKEDAFYLEWIYAMTSLKYWSKYGPKILGDRRARAHSRLFPTNTIVERHVPHGVVGVIGPWNYPFVNSMGDAIPALLAGNAVLLKPASKTPLTSLLMQRGMKEVGFPDDIFQVVIGPGAVGGELVEHVDMIMFTGSTETGKGVGLKAAERMIPFSLELGGKDPMIVLADADVKQAAAHAVYYSFINGGQTCMSIERIYVEAPIYDEFVARVADRVKELRTGDPAGGFSTVEIGAMTVTDQTDIVDEQVKDAIAKGARLVCGGKRRDPADGASFYEPTVLADVDHSMEIMVEETFGPTLQVQKVESAEEAIRLSNDSPYGLAGAVYSGDLARAEAVARRLETGTVAINDSLVFWVELQLPLGGWKQSGAGDGRHGEIGILKYTKTQGLFISRSPLKVLPSQFPYKRGNKLVHNATKKAFKL